MFDELLATPGVTEELTIGSRIGVMAFHGGNLERMTDVIADQVIARTGASGYVIRQPAGLRWHVPSKLVDPAHSASLAEFLDHVDVAIALHGYGRDQMFTTLLAGGSERELAGHLAGHLRSSLPDYDIVDDLDAIPEELRGLHPDNPVNRPRAGGVQLELPPRVRGLGPWWESRPHDGLSPHTEQLIAGLAAAVLDW